MLEQEVIKIMSEVFKIDSSSLNNETTQKMVAEWDSLKHLNLIVEIEEKYDISLDPEEIGEMVSVKSIVEMILKYKGK